MCFACGKKNPIGLKLEFEKLGEEYVTEFIPKAEHQGYEGITHGGIIATLLDEAMARLVWQDSGGAVTAEMNLRLKKPAPTGRKLRISARITGGDRRRVFCEAKAIEEEGAVVAEATAVIFRVKADG